MVDHGLRRGRGRLALVRGILLRRIPLLGRGRGVSVGVLLVLLRGIALVVWRGRGRVALICMILLLRVLLVRVLGRVTLRGREVLLIRRVLGSHLHWVGLVVGRVL